MKKKYDFAIVSGGFDPVHVGHLRMFQDAKKLANKVVVLLNNDDWLIKKKGKPFMSQTQRKEILDELYPFGLVEAGNTEMMYNKSVSILNGENQDIKENSKFLKFKMCNETLKFYEEVIS